MTGSSTASAPGRLNGSGSKDVLAYFMFVFMRRQQIAAAPDVCLPPWRDHANTPLINWECPIFHPGRNFISSLCVDEDEK